MKSPEKYQYIQMLQFQVIPLNIIIKSYLIIRTLFAVIDSQEGVIDLGGLNLTPEINTAGAAFTPKLNMIANNFTRWDLFVEDVQV